MSKERNGFLASMKTIACALILGLLGWGATTLLAHEIFKARTEMALEQLLKQADWASRRIDRLERNLGRLMVAQGVRPESVKSRGTNEQGTNQN